MDIYSVSVYTHLLLHPQANNHVCTVGEGMCVLSLHLAMCVRGAPCTEVTVRLEQQKNDLQGLFSLISIQGKEIDRDNHFADGAAPFFFPNQEESVKKKKQTGEASALKKPRSFHLYLYIYLKNKV